MRTTLKRTVVTSVLTTSLLATFASAAPIMTKQQYADYSVLYRCAEQKFHDDLEKKESELIRIEKQFGLNDDNFDAFDELVTEYERDDQLLEDISIRAKEECK